MVRQRASPALWVTVIEEWRRNNEKNFCLHPPLLCCSPSLPPSHRHLSFISSAPLLSLSSLSGSLFPHCDEEEGLPPTWFWWEISAAVREEVGAGDEDKRPNKVHLNIEAARPFFPCPYKELLVNPSGLSSSLYRELIPPSVLENITAGAWKHALTHTNTQSYVVLWERGQGAHFFSSH